MISPFLCLQSASGRTDTDAKDLALDLANAARDNALNPRYKSPWILEAAAAGKLPMLQRIRPRGGKLDDCTAVVVFADLAASKLLDSKADDVPAVARAG